jgi:hypothetical protein
MHLRWFEQHEVVMFVPTLALAVGVATVVHLCACTNSTPERASPPSVATVIAVDAQTATPTEPPPVRPPVVESDAGAPPRVIAGRWAITVNPGRHSFTDAEIRRAFLSAQPRMRECLRDLLLPRISASVRLVWSSAGPYAMVTKEDRGLGECAAAALREAAWPPSPNATLDIVAVMREPDERE